MGGKWDGPGLRQACDSWDLLQAVQHRSSTVLPSLLPVSMPCFSSLLRSLQTPAAVTPVTLVTSGFYAAKHIKQLGSFWLTFLSVPSNPACVWTFSFLLCLPKFSGSLPLSLFNHSQSPFPVCLFNSHHSSLCSENPALSSRNPGMRPMHWPDPDLVPTR